MSTHPHFIVAASLGAGIQPTAIAVVEQEVLKSDRWGLETGALRLRHLERLPVETTYPKTVDRISTLLDTPEIKDGEKCYGAEVVLDITGSGRAILELFERAEIHPVVVRIVGTWVAGVPETIEVHVRAGPARIQALGGAGLPQQAIVAGG